MSTFKVDQVDFQTEQYVVQSAAAILCAHTVLYQFQMPLREEIYIISDISVYCCIQEYRRKEK